MGSTKFPLVPPPQGGTPSLPVPGQPGPLKPGEFAGGSVSGFSAFSLRGIGPPSTLYIQRDDLILLDAITNQVGETVTFNLRHLQVPVPAGGQPDTPAAVFDPAKPALANIVTLDTEVLTLTQNTIATRVVQLGEGFLLGISAIPNLSNTRGQCFARAFLIRGGQTNNFVRQVLFSDYITGQGPTGFPGGRIVSQTEGTGWVRPLVLGAQALGTDWIVATAGVQRLRVGSLAGTFVASGTVANRNVQLIADDGAGNTYWIADAGVSITAGQTVQITATTTNVPTGVITTIQNIVLPPGLILPPAHRLRASTVNIQAGDQWTSINVQVEQWLDAS